MLPFIVAGLTTGSIFGLAAIGLVLTYKTSGIFNFAHGALASASAFLFYFLADQHGVAWPVAAAICVFGFGPLLGLVLELLTRKLAQASLTLRVLATIGLLLAIEGTLELFYPPGPYRQVNQFLPAHVFHIGSTGVYAYQLIIFAVGVVGVAALTGFLRYSELGLTMRAVVDNPELLDVMGTSPRRVRRFAWMIGTVTVTASGVLLAPLLPLDATTLTFLVVTAFGAAAVGAFRNIPVTYIAGLAIGIGQALLEKYFVSSSGLAGGLAPSLPFLILFVLLLVAPRLRRPSPGIPVRRMAAEAWQAPRRVRVGSGIAVLAVLALVPQFAGIHLMDWTDTLAYVVLFLSLGLLVRMSGQVSLAHVSFMAIGVAAFSHLAVGEHLPWGIALIVAALIVAPIGAVLAIPAIRFPGLYLALATLGFGILLQQMFYSQSYMFTDFGSGLTVPRPSWSWLQLTSDKQYYYLVLVITLLVAAIVFLLNRSRLGRLLRAMSDSPTGLRSCGTSINVCRVLVFCLSASLAAVAGVLDGGTIGIVSGDGYQPLLSLQIFALIMLTVGEAPWYALVAATAQVLIPSYISTGPTIGYAFTAWFGVSAIAVSVLPPGSVGLPEKARRAIDRLGGTQRAPAPAAGSPASSEPPRARQAAGAGAGLKIDGLTVRFGGLTAVDQVDLRAMPRAITGLIGPNGAGKTTIFNACSGLLRPASGVVRFNDLAIGRLGPPARARRGLGRTFQQMELFDSRTTLENVAMGCEAAFAGMNPLSHLLATRRQSKLVRQRTDEAIALCGIENIARLPVSALSTGQRRLVELARCLAGRYEILLLDEPSSGLDRVETERFGQILRQVVAERQVGILLVEHDMSLVNQVCDYIYVVDFGRGIFDGTFSQVLESRAVQEAYLGSAGQEFRRAEEDKAASAAGALEKDRIDS
jgi:ABC-type branched-subunit amino acid transport system ATPase component/branched-subunit amino acid ABC-type transport system permease component